MFIILMFLYKEESAMSYKRYVPHPGVYIKNTIDDLGILKLSLQIELV